VTQDELYFCVIRGTHVPVEEPSTASKGEAPEGDFRGF
jgi:hypothetical protein